MFGERGARAEGPKLHAAVGGAHAFGAPQEQELGWGGGARLTAELPLGAHFGLEASGSALSLSQNHAPEDPRYASRAFGIGWGIAGLARVSAKGAWADAGGGVIITGDQVRPMVEARIGYDVRIGKTSPWTMGPFVGYTQIFQAPDALRPEDAHVVWLGLEVSLGKKPKDVPILIEIAKNVPPPPRAPGDRDHDMVSDVEDACPDVPGIPTSDPKTNGCPSDRDHDEIADVDDACPDVPGVPTPDASTNGCPPTPMRMVGDRIVLDDIIHFGFGSPDVSESSKPLVKKIAEYLIARGDVTAVDIEGHADEIGSYMYNVNLSRDRANSVKKLLVEYGVVATLTVHAWSWSKPRAVGHDELQLRQNRRVEFIVTRQRQVPEDQEGAGENAHASTNEGHIHASN